MQFDIGRSIKAVRKSHGCSLRDLEKLSGYSRGYISDIEAGRRRPHLFVLRCILDAMGTGTERDEIVAHYVALEMGKAC